ncbi:GNAT family N-acetyltransferase [Haloferax larsenii]|uniref:Ribosomal protein S18 acetylase RimI n=1 Tax=Haloferax larsenii TaxID=302484 RepID=A0A1H7MU80_HALLR|nr:GNAT family N-acetyltransferase [Haloferax larsenii]SEL14358.1 Ribosomal protein S18 acetylase RimI [Haloferax larsenii]
MFIRAARHEDVPDIAHICATGWRDATADIVADENVEATVETRFETSRLEREVRRADDMHGWVVAVEDGRVVAAGGGGLTGTKSGEVFALHVRPDARGSGAGTALLRTITAQHVVGGAREQWASCLDGDEETLAFYRARGFDVTGRTRHDALPTESLQLVREI